MKTGKAFDERAIVKSGQLELVFLAWVLFPFFSSPSSLLPLKSASRCIPVQSLKRLLPSSSKVVREQTFLPEGASGTDCYLRKRERRRRTCFLFFFLSLYFSLTSSSSSSWRESQEFGCSKRYEKETFLLLLMMHSFCFYCYLYIGYHWVPLSMIAFLSEVTDGVLLKCLSFTSLVLLWLQDTRQEGSRAEQSQKGEEKRKR